MILSTVYHQSSSSSRDEDEDVGTSHTSSIITRKTERQKMKEHHWIEAPEGWGQDDKQEEGTEDGRCLLDLFERTDPSESFSFDVKLNNGATKSILLSGFKLDSDETDRSTGVTIWDAAPRLVNYLQQNVSTVAQKSVLELGAGLGDCA